MITSQSALRGCMRTLVAASALAFISTSASAGECPADQMVENGQMPSTAAAMGVTDNVIGMIDLKDEAPMLADHRFRLRQLTIEPGGVVPWHSHAERPAIIYIVSGKILEYRNTCAVPIEHKAGEVATETHATAHWWKNDGSEPVVLLSADILKEMTDGKTM